MTRYLVGFCLVVIAIIVMAIAGQFGRDLAKRTIASKEHIEIRSIADQYAEASKKMTSALSEFAKADKEIKRSVEQLRSLKELLLESQSSFEHHEKIRSNGHSYLINNIHAFGKEFYDDMLFTFGLEHISASNQAFCDFSSNYLELIDYSIQHFDRIITSTEPEITCYNGKLRICEMLRQKYNEAYIAKMDALKLKYGDSEVNQLTKELKE